MGHQACHAAIAIQKGKDPEQAVMRRCGIQDGIYLARFGIGIFEARQKSWDGTGANGHMLAHARITFALNFFNGHTCDLEGTAELKGNKLVFTDPEGWDGKVCRLEIWRQGKDLRWTDRDNGCHSYCGMRGNLTGGRMALKYRQPLPARP